MGTLEIIYLLLAILFLAICAFFASAEIGFINLQRFRLKHLQEEGVRGADRVARIMEQPSRFLSVVLTGISFAETIVVALGTIFIVALLGEGVGTPVAIVAIAILLLIFAKVIPKTIAAQHPERIALLYARPIEIMSRALHPFVVVLSWIAGWFTPLAHSSTIPGELISREELGTIISMGEDSGVVDEASAEILRSVVSLGERRVREVMIPRTEAAWLENGVTLGQFLENYAEHPAQRYPVYDDSYDKVTGVLSIGDVLTAMSGGSIGAESVVTDLSRPVYFVPGSKSVCDLLADMKAEGYSLAVVLNEYGGTSGVVTIEQVVEQIVGEVREELAAAETGFEVIGEHLYKVDGGMRVEEVNDQLQLGIPEGDYKTVGGFVLDLLGHLPKQGEQVVQGPLTILVSEVKENKVARVFVMKGEGGEEREEISL
ncbi:MAG: hemolysin family protein [Chloroflexota bacterium]|nr:hemolysin family protein [Chloroflexota bacterium]